MNADIEARRAAGDRIALAVNGQAMQTAAGASVAHLLVELGMSTGAVAVEVNRDLVPRARHATTVLGDGDEVEIVTLVGGG